MKLHNTLTRKVEDFIPINEGEVRIYSCGPTVYDHAHIGNLSAYIFADTLRRTLTQAGYKVTQVMNYTDVDDKTIARSREKYPDLDPKAALQKLTDEYIELFMDDMKKIGVDTDAITFVRATDNIDAMKTLITKLYDAKIAYVADDGVYFSIEAYRKSGKKYGQLLELSSDNTGEARIHNDEYDKESTHDFALWKTQKENEPAWEFELDGKNLTGRPGWHIECSAMSETMLGLPFDIHTGGVDLIFPHHENEIAQSTAIGENNIMANFFTHNEHVLVGNKKMAKSEKNFYTLKDIIEKGFDPLAFRLLVLQSHYRKPTNFSWENLKSAQNRLNELGHIADLRWQLTEQPLENTSFDLNGYTKSIRERLINDLNTPQVLADLSVFSTVLLNGEKYLHLTSNDFEKFLNFSDSILGLKIFTRPDINNEQKELIQKRSAAKEKGEFATADALRQQLKQQGVGLEDRADTTRWYRI